MKTIALKNKWHVNEVAIYGTTCEAVKAKVHEVQELCASRRLIYIDASHQEGDIQGNEQLTTHSQFFELKSNGILDETTLLEFDGALVNGNHHEASAQVILVNHEKEVSLKKRLSQLTQVEAIILPKQYEEVPDFITALVGSEVPVIRENSEEEKVFWRNKYPVPSLKALVLVGGKSSRMGQEKGLIDYHGQSQASWISQLLQSFGIEVYLSCRPEQQNHYAHVNVPFVFDSIEGGPLGGILSALRNHKNSAFLVVACDLPNLNRAVIEKLISNRRPEKYATCFESPMDQGPEPLCSIYEPKSASALAQVWANGKNCPRKILFNRDVSLVTLANSSLLANVNTPQDRAKIAH